MANEIFWDTSGFYALLASDDKRHLIAVDILGQLKKERTMSITSDWIIGETCTLLGARQRGHMIPKFLDLLADSKMLQRNFVASDTIAAAEVFLRRNCTRGYSYTDCISFMLMRERKLTKALTADEHFRDQKFEALLL